MKMSELLFKLTDSFNLPVNVFQGKVETLELKKGDIIKIRMDGQQMICEFKGKEYIIHSSLQFFTKNDFLFNDVTLKIQRKEKLDSILK